MAPKGVLKPDLLVIGDDPAGFEIAFAAASLGVPVMLALQGASPEAREPRRLAALGVTLLPGSGAFLDPRRFGLDAHVVEARRFVIATGATPRPAGIAGEDLPPRWSGDSAGAHLLVLGGGAEAIASAQAARRAGARVTLVSPGPLLPDFDAESVALLRVKLEREGIFLREGLDFARCTIAAEGGGFAFSCLEGQAALAFTHLEIRTGATPDLAALAPEAAGIALQDGRPRLDAARRSTNRRIYIVGGATGRPTSPHLARAEAGAVIREILFRAKGAINPALEPRLARLDPLLAEAGLSERDIPAGKAARYRFHRVSLAETSHSGGQIKVIATPAGEIRGVSIIGAGADTLLAPLLLAMATKTPLSALAGLPLPGASEAEALALLGRAALREKLASPGTRRLLRLLRLFG